MKRARLTARVAVVVTVTDCVVVAVTVPPGAVTVTVSPGFVTVTYGKVTVRPASCEVTVVVLVTVVAAQVPG